MRSRRELIAKVFSEQHWPRYGDGDAALTSEGWFQAKAAAENATQPG